MDERLVKIKNALTEGALAELDNEEFTYSDRLKFAITVLLDYPHKHRHELVSLIQTQYDSSELSSSYCYKLLSDAQELFPSLEKVNKAFEVARLIKITYRFLNMAESKKNLRDGSQLLKVLKDLIALAGTDEANNGVTIINILKSAPETLNVTLPENFNLNKFIADVEREFSDREVIDVEYEEQRS